MAMHDIYSKRQKRIRGEMPDVYTYETINEALRNQVKLIILEITGPARGNNFSRMIYSKAINILCREWGEVDLIKLIEKYYEDDALFLKFLNEGDIDRCLDIIEVIFLVIAQETLHHHSSNKEVIQNLIAELNQRFKEHGLGYELLNNEIVRIDTQIIHAEAVRPAIGLLNEEGFEGAQEEFLSAYSHYRIGNNKEAITEANKAFESTMKVICKRKNWSYKSSDTAKKLIVICMENGLFPSYYQSHLSALANLLEGVATIRNNDGGHGQGPEIKIIDSNIASYVLHMTASAVVLLARSAT